MQKHPDADAFMRSYLEQPTDTVSRLVFADWLEETGEPHLTAWAHFIRARIEANRYPPDSPERHKLDREADTHAPHIRARLTIPAQRFIDYPKSLLQLLPAPNITVRLTNFTIPRVVCEYMPESVARENQLMLLAVQERVLLIAAVNPRDTDLAQKLEFILNRDIILVGAEREDVQDALDRHYGEWNVEYVDSVLVEFVDTAVDLNWGVADDHVELADEPVVRLVNLIFQEAVALRADSIRIVAGTEVAVVSYLIKGEWVERDNIPRRLRRPVTARIATMAWLHVDSVLAEPPVTPRHVGTIPIQIFGVRFLFTVTITPTPDGPATHIDISRTPVVVEDR
jgi:uncharacterized protein (TIGR02996 family)